MFFTKTEQ